MPIVKASRRDKTTSDALLCKLTEMQLELVHMKGLEMPADALSRQALREIKGNKKIVI